MKRRKMCIITIAAVVFILAACFAATAQTKKDGEKTGPRCL